jgi:hypothetical protein
MSANPYQSPSQLGVRPAVQLSTSFLTQAFFWMFIGLLVTTGVGVAIAGLPAETMADLAGLVLPVLILQLVVAFVLSLGIRRMSATLGLLLFFVYAALMGVTLGVVLVAYELGSVLAAGSAAAATFGGAALYGVVTRRDLTSMGAYLFMGLIGIIVAMFVNFFIGWTWLSFAISVVGVVIFTGLTAYDVQRIKNGDVAVWAGSMDKGAVMAAFSLYLDFVNLFLMFVRLFGNSRG